MVVNVPPNELASALNAAEDRARRANYLRCIYSKLQAGYLASRQNNPHYNAVMASPPIVALTATVPAGLTKAYISQGALSQGLLETGGDKLAYSGGTRFPCATQDAAGTGGNVSNGRNAIGWRVKVKTNSVAPAFRVVQNSPGYRFVVNGQYVDLTPTAASNGGYSNWIQLTFPAQAEREIWVEGTLAAAFHSACVTPIETVATPAAGLTISVFGDSITAATGATNGNDGFAQVLGDAFGAGNLLMSGIGSQGFLAPSNAGGLYTFRQRFLYDYRLSDVIAIAFGTNDEGYLTSALETEVVTTLKLIRSRHAGPIFVIGCPANASGPSSLPISVDGYYLSAVKAFADPDCFFIPNSTALPESIQNGTGKVGATNGSGNSDWTVSADGTHPPTAGHLYLGFAYADLIYAAIAGR